MPGLGLGLGFFPFFSNNHSYIQVSDVSENNDINTTHKWYGGPENTGLREAQLAYTTYKVRPNISVTVSNICSYVLILIRRSTL